MEIERFDRLQAQVIAASAYQLLVLESLLGIAISQRVPEIALARRTKQSIQSRCCPRCASNNVVLHGRDQNKRQRFKCRACRRTYNIMTGTPMARACKPEKWGHYLDCMTNHMPVRAIIKTGIGVNHVTAWRWRHRFLKAAVDDNAATLSGVIEVERTFFAESFKGSRGRKQGPPPTPRPPHQRGRDATRQGSPPVQVPVLTAVDSGGAVFQAILKPTSGIETEMDGRIAAGSVLCSCANAAYVKVADKANAEHYIVSSLVTTPNAHLIVPQARRSRRLGLDRVNNHHEHLKYLIMGRCCGVATKFLDNYLGWHRAMIKPGFKGKALLDRALAL